MCKGKYGNIIGVLNMSISATAPVTPIRKDLVPPVKMQTGQPEESSDALKTRETAPEKLSGATSEKEASNRKPEIMLFSKMAPSVSNIIPKSTAAAIKHTAEYVGSVFVSVNTPTSTTTSEGRSAERAGFSGSVGLPTILSSGITATQESKNGFNQEHQENGRNVYLSAQKNKDAIHLEELYQSDINNVFDNFSKC